MTKIIERNNWIVVEQNGAVVFEGEELDGRDLRDVLEGEGIELVYQYIPGIAPRD